MKVVLLFSKFITDPTGASAVMHNLKDARSLFEKQGVSLTCFTRDNLYPNYSLDLSLNKKSKFPGIKSLILRFIETKCRCNPLFAILHNYIRSGRAGKILIDTYLSKYHDDDIVFLHEIDVCYYYLKRRSKLNKAKVVLVSHNDGELYGALKVDYPCLTKGFFNRILSKRERYVLANINKLGFVSKSSMNNFKKRNCNFPDEKLFYCLNGIPDVEITHDITNSKRYNICCVGTVNERKGQRFIIEAMIRLPQVALDKIHVNLIGDGNLKEELQTLCQNNGISQYVTFWGSRKDVIYLLAQNNIFILPSINEGLPIAIMEAMRQGLPIVSTRVGGIPEMIEDGLSGIFIDPSVEGVQSFLMNIDKYNWIEMGVRSRILYKNKFSIENMVNTYSIVFNSLM